MIEPYRMVIVNLSLFFALLIGIILYHYVYPKKNINLFFLLCILSFFPIISIFRSGVYESGDFTIHIYRAISFYRSLNEGILMPSWAGDLNATYGYAAFIFLHPLPYYLQALFHALGASFVDSLKIVLALSYVSSGIFFYLWAKRETQNPLAAFSGAIVYLFVPYHLVDLHFRVALGETVFFAILPLFFYTFSFLKEKQTLLFFLINALSYALLLFTHQAMAVLCSIIIFPYLIYSAYLSKSFVRSIAIFFSIPLVGFIISIASWLPHILYPQFTYISLLAKQTIIFPNVTELLYSSWRYGLLFQGPNGELSYIIGYTQLLLIVFCVVLVLTKGVQKKDGFHLAFWSIITLVLIFMMTPLSTIVWRSLPILNTAQFASRLLLPLAFCVASLMVYASLVIKKHQFIIVSFLVLTVAYTLLNWGQRRIIPQLNEHSLIMNLPKSTYEGEGLTLMGSPKWIDIKNPWKKDIPQYHLAFTKGGGEIRELQRSSTRHTYLIATNDVATLQENTYYFPGWKVIANEKIIQHTYTKGANPGLITFSVDPGLYKIDLIYTDLPLLMGAKIITFTTTSLVILVIILLSFIAYNKKDKYHA